MDVLAFPDYFNRNFWQVLMISGLIYVGVALILSKLPKPNQVVMGVNKSGKILEKYFFWGAVILGIFLALFLFIIPLGYGLLHPGPGPCDGLTGEAMDWCADWIYSNGE